MVQYTAKHESITGASLSGSSGDAGRTYTLTNSDAIAAQMSVSMAGNSLQQGLHFTFSTATNAITIIGAAFDSMAISIDYLVQDSITLSSSTYCTTLQIAEYAGIGIAIELENVGTGDNSATSFDVDNGNIVDGSYTLRHGASGANSLSNLTETTHYTLTKDDGRIELTSAGVTAVGTNLIYISYTHSPKHSDTVLAKFLGPASREAEKMTSNYWGPVKTTTQYFDGYDDGYPHTNGPFGNQIDNGYEFELNKRGVATITSLKFLDKTGAVSSTVDSTNYRIVTDGDEDNDSRLLISVDIPNGKANVQVIYTHGYTTVPDLVQELAALLGGLRALVNISGGSYKDVTSYSLGRKSFGLGEVYVNIRETITQMKRRIDDISNELGGVWGCA